MKQVLTDLVRLSKQVERLESDDSRAQIRDLNMRMKIVEGSLTSWAILDKDSGVTGLRLPIPQPMELPSLSSTDSDFQDSPSLATLAREEKSNLMTPTSQLMTTRQEAARSRAVFPLGDVVTHLKATTESNTSRVMKLEGAIRELSSTGSPSSISSNV